ncbi:uncharacterized protein AB675_1584 [Cyphellophora attinorum]|uniref:Uncharacterized protein n=1 Tax=Cyphellophora attinorum TaxID=1664694 RepID=A0A0N1NYL9_9EURO|nr:uncharacterized protein AB675_1584 [Phialophora attinorum]KPI37240.1 hypothetical protein AB675_1584 [Phialophora attinorum]
MCGRVKAQPWLEQWPPKSLPRENDLYGTPAGEKLEIDGGSAPRPQPKPAPPKPPRKREAVVKAGDDRGEQTKAQPWRGQWPPMNAPQENEFYGTPAGEMLEIDGGSAPKPRPAPKPENPKPSPGTGKTSSEGGEGGGAEYVGEQTKRQPWREQWPPKEAPHDNDFYGTFEGKILESMTAVAEVVSQYASSDTTVGLPTRRPSILRTKDK